MQPARPTNIFSSACTLLGQQAPIAPLDFRSPRNYRDAEQQEKESSDFCRLFAGSGVVSRLARQNGYRVIANDWEPYSHALNHAILACVDAPAFKELGGYQKPSII